MDYKYYRLTEYLDGLVEQRKHKSSHRVEEYPGY